MTAMHAAPTPSSPTLRFIRRGEIVSLVNVAPSRTLLQVLREDLGCTGTKEGCAEGDCGACTVVVGEAEGGRIRLRAVNSCIKLAHSLNGLALWTVEDLAAKDGTLHPAQQAMVDCHGSQCGFCTPGFVMSLFALYQAPTLPTASGSLPLAGALRLRPGEAGSAAPTGESGALGPSAKRNPITRAMAQEALSGNLCRCTGYQPILKAAQAMAALPPVAIDETRSLQKMDLLTPVFADFQPDSAYKLPRTLAQLLALRAADTEAQLVAGCTDVGLWVTKQQREFERVIDLSRVAELRRIEEHPQHVAFGAAVTLADAYAALVRDRPQLQAFAARFAGLPVRNAGTLGGNVANGSPIGDSMPLLIALRASLVLMSLHCHRELAIEDFYTGYRQTLLAADEVLAWIKVPKADAQASVPGLQIYKISKRFDDDISAVCLAIDVQLDDGRVGRVSIGVGGVAATPVRARHTEAALLGQPWTEATLRHAITALRAEFTPLSDMRASSAYRREALGNLLQRYWLESEGMQQINLQSFSLPDSV